MAQFTFNATAETISKNTGAGKKVQSGLQLLKIVDNAVIVDGKGNTCIDLTFENEAGGKAVVFHTCLAPTWSTGTENYDFAKTQNLVICAGIPTATTIPHTVTRKGAPVACSQVEGLTGKTLWVSIGIRKDVDMNNVETESYVIYDFATEDFKTADQVLTGVPGNKDLLYVGKDSSTAKHKEAKAMGTLKKPAMNNNAETPAPAAAAVAPVQANLFS